MVVAGEANGCDPANASALAKRMQLEHYQALQQQVGMQQPEREILAQHSLTPLGGPCAWIGKRWSL
jgi:hypothetical protein